MIFFLPQAKLRAEMDEEFGISDLVEEEFGSLTRPTRQVRIFNSILYKPLTLSSKVYVKLQLKAYLEKTAQLSFY